MPITLFLRVHTLSLSLDASICDPSKLYNYSTWECWSAFKFFTFERAALGSHSIGLVTKLVTNNSPSHNCRSIWNNLLPLHKYNSFRICNRDWERETYVSLHKYNSFRIIHYIYRQNMSPKCLKFVHIRITYVCRGEMKARWIYLGLEEQK